MMSDGTIPAGWAAECLGKLDVEIFDGPFGSHLKTSDYADSGVRVIRLENIGHGRFIDEKRSFISEEKYRGIRKHTVAPGDIVFSSFVTGAIQSALVPAHIPLGVNKADCFCVRFFGKTTSAKYVQLFLQSRNAFKQIEAMIHGVGRPRINTSQLKQLIVPIAPKREQVRIIAKIEELFSELNKAIETLTTAREQLDIYRLAVLKSAFEGKITENWRSDSAGSLETADVLFRRIRNELDVRYEEQMAVWRGALEEWEQNGRVGLKPKKPLHPKRMPPISGAEASRLSELPEGWLWTRLGEIAGVGTGVTPLRSKDSYYSDGDIPWVTSGALNEPFVHHASANVTPTAYNETNLKLHPPHTLLVALYGEGKTRGKCSELLIEATTNQAIAAIVLEGEAAGLRSFLKWFLTKNYELIRLDSSGGVQPNLNLGVIENMPIPICSLDEARRLSGELTVAFSRIDQCEAEISSQIDKCAALQQSILAKAFSGQLVAQDPKDEPASALLERIRAECEDSMTKKERNNKNGKKKAA